MHEKKRISHQMIFRVERFIVLVLSVVILYVSSCSYAQSGDLLTTCNPRINAMWLLDISETFALYVKTTKNLISEFVTSISQHENGSRASFAGFSDIAMPDLGWQKWEPIDVCFKVLLDPTTNHDDISEMFDKLSLYSGRDEPEAQLLALHHVASVYFGPPSRDYLNLIIMMTDSSYHVAGDAQKMRDMHDSFRKDSIKAFYMPKYDFTVFPNDGDAVLNCDGREIEDYPTLEQVVFSLKSIDAAVIFLVTHDELKRYQGLQLEMKELGFDNAIVMPFYFVEFEELPPIFDTVRSFATKHCSKWSAIQEDSEVKIDTEDKIDTENGINTEDNSQDAFEADPLIIGSIGAFVSIAAIMLLFAVADGKPSDSCGEISHPIITPRVVFDTMDLDYASLLPKDRACFIYDDEMFS